MVRATANQMDTSSLAAHQEKILEKMDELTPEEYVAYGKPVTPPFGGRLTTKNSQAMDKYIRRSMNNILESYNIK